MPEWVHHIISKMVKYFQLMEYRELIMALTTMENEKRSCLITVHSDNAI